MKRELPDGYSVKYEHRHGRDRIAPTRLRLRRNDLDCVCDGHSTTALIRDERGSLVGIGVAMCRPEDQFSKRLGRTIALGRALKAVEEGK